MMCILIEIRYNQYTCFNIWLKYINALKLYVSTGASSISLDDNSIRKYVLLIEVELSKNWLNSDSFENKLIKFGASGDLSIPNCLKQQQQQQQQQNLKIK